MPFEPLDLGPEIVRRMLPQRPPFLMIDRVDAFDSSGPAVRASRFLTANESVFQGHFPELALLPGAHMVEGASQAASLAYLLREVVSIYAEQGFDEARMRADLENIQRGFTFHPGYRHAPDAPILAVMERVGGLPLGVSGEVRFKFLAPVPPGCRLVYEARLTHRLGDQLRFDVSASAHGGDVMRGSVAAAVVPPRPLPGLRR